MKHLKVPIILAVIIILKINNFLYDMIIFYDFL